MTLWDAFDVFEAIRWWRLTLCVLAFAAIAALLNVAAGVPIDRSFLLGAAGCGAVVGVFWGAVGALVRWLRS